MEAILISVVRSDGQVLGQFYLGEGDHLIGREDHCPVHIQADQVSREHARLSISPAGIFIEDLGSTSGTFLDGVRISGRIQVNPAQKLHVSDLLIDVPQNVTVMPQIAEEKVHVSRDGQQFGPYTIAQVQSHLADGALIASDMAWIEGSAQWVPITSITQAPSAPGMPAPPAAGGPPKPEGMIKKFLFLFLSRGKNENESLFGVLLDNIGRVATIVAIITFLIGGVYWYIGKVGRDDYKKKVLAAAEGEAKIILDSSERGNAKSTVIAARNFFIGGKGGQEGDYPNKLSFADGSRLKENKELADYFVNKLVEQAGDDPEAKYQLVLLILRKPKIIYTLAGQEAPSSSKEEVSGEIFDRYKEKMKTWIKESAEGGSLDGKFMQVLFEMKAEELDRADNSKAYEIALLGEEVFAEAPFDFTDSLDEKYLQRIKDIADEGHGYACGTMAYCYFIASRLTFGFSAPKGKVTLVSPDTPIAKAGVKVGDELGVVFRNKLVVNGVEKMDKVSYLDPFDAIKYATKVNEPRWNVEDSIEFRFKNRGDPEKSAYVTPLPYGTVYGKIKLFSLPYKQLIELQHKYSWEGAHRGNLFSMACLGNIYALARGSKYLEMDPDTECILTQKWINQFEYSFWPESGTTQSEKDPSGKAGLFSPLNLPDRFTKHPPSLSETVAKNLNGYLIYFAINSDYAHRYGAKGLQVKNWKNIKSPQPITDGQKEQATEKRKSFIPNLLLADCGDKQAQQKLALYYHRKGEFSKSYKWFLIAKENGSKLAELQMDNFDWDRKHKKEGEKMAAGFNPKKNPYPYSW